MSVCAYLSFRVDISDTLMYVYEMLGAELLSNLYDKLGRLLTNAEQPTSWQVGETYTDEQQKNENYFLFLWVLHRNQFWECVIPYPVLKWNAIPLSTRAPKIHCLRPPPPAHRSLTVWLPVHSWDDRCELLWRHPRPDRTHPQNQHQQRPISRHSDVHYRWDEFHVWIERISAHIVKVQTNLL